MEIGRDDELILLPNQYQDPANTNGHNVVIEH